MNGSLPSETLAAGLAALRTYVPQAPECALVLGSGLGALGDSVSDALRVPYTAVPNMPASRVAGHAGNFVFGRLAGRRVVMMQGRVHLYEGHEPEQVVYGARLMLLLGARTLIVSNAAGGIRADMQPGNLMLIEDHLNLTGHNCLRGPNDPALGPRFPDMSAAYDAPLRAHAAGIAARLGVNVCQGVYAGLLGPNYETPAEIRMLRTLGADAVGMSTVLEVIAARHMGARVLGVSCITNLAAGLSKHELNHAEVQSVATSAQDAFTRWITTLVGELPA